jgi:hypothetical protein
MAISITKEKQTSLEDGKWEIPHNQNGCRSQTLVIRLTKAVRAIATCKKIQTISGM